MTTRPPPWTQTSPSFLKTYSSTHARTSRLFWLSLSLVSSRLSRLFVPPPREMMAVGDGGRVCGSAFRKRGNTRRKRTSAVVEGPASLRSPPSPSFPLPFCLCLTRLSRLSLSPRARPCALFSGKGKGKRLCVDAAGQTLRLVVPVCSSLCCCCCSCFHKSSFPAGGERYVEASEQPRAV